jgi:hypothetical protein
MVYLIGGFYVFIITFVTVHPFATILFGPFIFFFLLATPYWYIPTIFFLPAIVISVVLVFALRFKVRSLAALLSVGLASLLFYTSFSIYLTYEIPRARDAITAEIVCQSRQSTFTILTPTFRESGRPHALIRSEGAAYIYSFRKREFVEVPAYLMPKTPCKPLNQ